MAMDTVSSYSHPLKAYDTLCHSLIDWAFRTAIQRAILKERHVMPKYFPGTSIPMLAGSALLQMNYVHFWNFKWQANTSWHPYTVGPPRTYDTGGLYLTERMLRHRLSINTCQGCHAGETKTVFTHVRPLGYGEEADYMGTVPGYHMNTNATVLKLDTRGVYNAGISNVLNGGNWQQDSNYSRGRAKANYYFQKVSPFITGRCYTGPLGNATFRDDHPTDAEDDKISKLNFYVVNDPANMTTLNSQALPPRVKQSTSLSPPVNLQHGFNELKRRVDDLCKLLNAGCGTNSIALEIFTVSTHLPLTE